MPPKATLSEKVEPTEKAHRALELLKERFRLPEIPAGLHLFAASEPGINDIQMNLNRQLADGNVTEKTKLIVAVGVASVIGGREGTNFFAEAALAAGRTKPEVLAAIAAASTCSIFNGYYRFRHQLPVESKATYEAFRAPFNANSLIKTTLQQLEIEAICIAVSSINNCAACVEEHLHKGISLGLTDEQVDEIIKVAAVAAATANLIATFAYGSMDIVVPTITA